MDLAHDISEVIKRLKQKIEAGQKAAAAPVIYLAETSSNQAAARDAIKRELRERGCVIVPSRPLLAAPDFEQAVGKTSPMRSCPSISSEKNTDRSRRMRSAPWCICRPRLPPGAVAILVSSFLSKIRKEIC